MEDIYRQPAGDAYQRTGDFYTAFKLSDLEMLVDEYVIGIIYDWNSMEPPSYGDSNNGYTHGNYEMYEDRRADLYWILNGKDTNDVNSDIQTNLEDTALSAQLEAIIIGMIL